MLLAYLTLIDPFPILFTVLRTMFCQVGQTALQTAFQPAGQWRGVLHRPADFFFPGQYRSQYQ